MKFGKFEIGAFTIKIASDRFIVFSLSDPIHFNGFSAIIQKIHKVIPNFMRVVRL